MIHQDTVMEVVGEFYNCPLCKDANESLMPQLKGEKDKQREFKETSEPGSEEKRIKDYVRLKTERVAKILNPLTMIIESVVDKLGSEKQEIDELLIGYEDQRKEFVIQMDQAVEEIRKELHKLKGDEGETDVFKEETIPYE